MVSGRSNRSKTLGSRSCPNHAVVKPRTFPTAILDDPVVCFCWPDAQLPPEARSALTDLCSKVTYIGHSASLVQAWVEGEPPEANWIPAEGVAARRRRIPGLGRLEHLESRYAATLRPTPSLWQAYTRKKVQKVEPDVSPSVFDDNLIILRRIGGGPFGLESTLQMTKAMRDTLMSKCPVQPPPEWMSGHKPDGGCSETPHLACVPLPNVGFEHSNGRLMGMAVIVPRIVPSKEMRSLAPLFAYDDEGNAAPITLASVPWGNACYGSRKTTAGQWPCGNPSGRDGQHAGRR